MDQQSVDLPTAATLVRTEISPHRYCFEFATFFKLSHVTDTQSFPRGNARIARLEAYAEA